MTKEHAHIENPTNEWFGMDAGKIWIANDFDELPEDVWNAMTDPKIFPDETDKDDDILIDT
jgi:hypothetical protein